MEGEKFSLLIGGSDPYSGLKSWAGSRRPYGKEAEEKRSMRAPAPRGRKLRRESVFRNG